jgi:hypothetical protein
VPGITTQDAVGRHLIDVVSDRSLLDALLNRLAVQGRTAEPQVVAVAGGASRLLVRSVESEQAGIVTVFVRTLGESEHA